MRLGAGRWSLPRRKSQAQLLGGPVENNWLLLRQARSAVVRFPLWLQLRIVPLQVRGTAQPRKVSTFRSSFLPSSFRAPRRNYQLNHQSTDQWRLDYLYHLWLVKIDQIHGGFPRSPLGRYDLRVAQSTSGPVCPGAFSLELRKLDHLSTMRPKVKEDASRWA